MASGDAQLLIGIHSVTSALDAAPDSILRLYLAAESKNQRAQKLAARAASLGVAVEQSDRRALDRLSRGERHQDVVAQYQPKNLLSERDLDTTLAAIDGPPLVLVLDGVQDPHNLGACLRSAEAAGVHLVVLPRDHSADLTPVARRAAAGAAEVLPVLYAANLARVLRALKSAGIWLLGTSDQAEQSIYDASLDGPMALVMGSEGSGMRRLTSELCDFLVSIPMAGAVSSLNVSVATGVCLFEMVRQRKD